MDKHLKGLWEYVAHNQDLSVEVRLFRLITLASSLLCICIVLPINILLDLPSSLNLVIALYGIATFCLYLISCKGMQFIRGYFAITILVLNAAWFLRAGSNGSIAYYFFAIVLYPLLFFRGFVRFSIFLLILLNNGILLLVEHHFPSLVTPFISANDRLIDQISGFSFSAIICALVFWVVVTTLEGELGEREVAEKLLTELNTELDLRVHERTGQLESALREQESFSYSVSHDLRAPLRHINSYVTILSEDFGDVLPPKAHRLLDRTRSAIRRMGNLIDDILELARVSRTHLAKKSINLSELATLVCNSLQEAEPHRDVELIINDGLRTQGDKPLVMQLMVNLLGNAWKYTSKNPAARIEFGKVVDVDQDIFYVKDNGVGFDMQYSDKLFGEFQRLHGSEFEGNGIGLATVKRIIDRHGGKVWAESTVNEGATFYFSLRPLAFDLLG